MNGFFCSSHSHKAPWTPDRPHPSLAMIWHLLTSNAPYTKKRNLEVELHYVYYMAKFKVIPVVLCNYSLWRIRRSLVTKYRNLEVKLSHTFLLSHERAQHCRGSIIGHYVVMKGMLKSSSHSYAKGHYLENHLNVNPQWGMHFMNFSFKWCRHNWKWIVILKYLNRVFFPQNEYV